MRCAALREHPIHIHCFPASRSLHTRSIPGTSNSFNGNVCTLIKIENCIQNVLHGISQVNSMCRHPLHTHTHRTSLNYSPLVMWRCILHLISPNGELSLQYYSYSAVVVLYVHARAQRSSAPAYGM